MASPPKAADVPGPRLFTEDQLIRALDGWRERDDQRRAALSSTDFETLEGATLEWVVADQSPSHAKLRARFEHGLSRVSDEDIAKLRALLRAIAAAAHENNVDALRQAAGFFDQYMSIDTKQAKLLRALELVEFASQGVTDDPAIAVKLVLLLTGIDSKFGKPRQFDVASSESQNELLSFVEKVLRTVRHGRARTKGGARNVGAAGALVKLLAFTGALEASTSAAKEKKKIDNAIGAKSKVVRQPKKAAKSR
ncbi:MAG: hypothetical protein ABI548_25355 [Polyangiaceae bacterium]